MTFSLEIALYCGIVTSTGALYANQALIEAVEKQNKEGLKKLNEQLAEAEKTEDESEISDALKARANYFVRKVRTCRDYGFLSRTEQ